MSSGSPGSRNPEPASDIEPLSAVEPRPVGVVLAGGKSSRMGRDKASMPWPPAEPAGVDPARGRSRSGPASTLGGHALARLGQVTSDLLVADGGRHQESGRWRGGVAAVPDGSGVGPAAGILGAARARPRQPLLVLACDLPMIPVELLAALARSTADVAVPVGPSGVEPLCALYSPRALEALTEGVERGELAPRTLAEMPGNLVVERIEGSRLAAFGDPSVLFANLNSPEDLRRPPRFGEELPMPLRGKSRS